MTTKTLEPRPTPKTSTKLNISSSRESVESFVFVFVFFLVLGVEAEGFVIPTGSMAPTLMGRHKEVTCPECGLVYEVNADREIGDETVPAPPVRIEAGTCVNCRFQAAIGDEPNFQGDRIYVMKTPIAFPGLGSPSVQLRRWDVAVFKLPEKPDVRYIKRLVGMPDETVRIQRGDIWVAPLDGSQPFTRPLRPLKHQDAMQILVYDDAHRPRDLAEDPRWRRWASRSPDGWQEDVKTPGTYRIQAGDDWVDLRYRHRVPDPEQWEAVLQGHPLPRPPRETLITDYYAYNTDLTSGATVDPMSSSKAWRQSHWVGDLTLDALLDVSESTGLVRFELVKAGVVNRCVLDLASGRATLWHGDHEIAPPTPAGLDRAGSYRIRFANVDDRLTLQVDGGPVFGEGVSFEPETLAPTAADLDPAGVAAQGAKVEVRGLVLKRDIYYTLDPAQADYRMSDLDGPYPGDPVSLFDWLSDPDRFEPFGKLQSREFPIRTGYYMMLGDNSPWSRDGRAWKRFDQKNPDDPTEGWDDSGRESWEVPESLLIGKAFCVYLPHFKPMWPALKFGRDLRLPARPYFEKMRWIR